MITTTGRGGLARSCALLDTRGDLVWVGGAVDDLLPDGVLEKVAPGLVGDVPVGAVYDYWCDHTHHLPVHTVGLCVRTNHWRALGGWMPLPSAKDDTAALLALNEQYAWYIHDETVVLWRRHPHQQSQGPTHAGRLASVAEVQIQQRVEALRRLSAIRHTDGSN